MSSSPENRRPPLRLLLVEDSAADAQLFRDSLEDHARFPIEVTWVTTLAAARRSLADPPDCVLLDVGLPTRAGSRA